MAAEPNAQLIPKPNRDHPPIWSQAGKLQISRDVRYISQPVMLVRTSMETLGVRAWHTISVREHDPVARSGLEIALALWCNSALGYLLHADYSNSAQESRGRGNKGMLETLSTLDVRKLDPWQLEATEPIWRDFKDRRFLPFASAQWTRHALT